jgi:SAM-dependent methyltransferase
MDFAPFDKRNYPVVDARAGYGEWAASYEETVAIGLDRPLLERVRSIPWAEIGQAADLACGTGRTGEWLKANGVQAIDGVDLTPQMLDIARSKGVYRRLEVSDIADTPLARGSYRLCAMSLADEHLETLLPAYREAARLLGPGGCFLLVGYHPFFLMNGMPTHYHRADGEAVAIASFVHLFSEHYEAGRACGLSLIEFQECVIDETWLETKPKWRRYLNWPISFAMVWQS